MKATVSPSPGCAMGEIIDLNAYRANRQLEEELKHLAERMGAHARVAPEDRGWRVLERAEDGEPVRWINLRYNALIGYVPGHPEWVYLDYRHRIQAFDLTLEELVAAIEGGTLPDPETELDSLGRPVD